MVYRGNQAVQKFSKSPKIKKANVTIGDYCWIGAYVFIREGMKIGDNVVVIGAHIVVTMDLPSYSVAVGVQRKL